MTENKKKVYDYNLYIKGLFGRNRKVKFESFKILENSDQTIDKNHIKEMVENALKEKVKPKGNYYLKVIEQECFLENDSGMEIKSFMLFSGTRILLEENRG